MAESPELRQQYEKLNAAHPDFLLWEPWWKVYFDAYTGAPDVYKYIKRHEREHKKTYAARKDRAYYLNYAEAVTDLGPSFVFSRDITRSSQPPEPPRPPEPRDLESAEPAPGGAPPKDESGGAPVNPGVSGDGKTPPAPLIIPPPEPEELIAPEPLPQDEDYEQFWGDPSRLGIGMDDFMKEVGAFARVFGRVDVLVDMPMATSDVLSEQDRLDQELYPYTVLYFPWDVRNWEVDQFGRYLWVRIKQIDTTQVDPFGNRKSRPNEIFTTWTAQEWVRHTVVFNDKGEISEIRRESNTHPCGRVPLVSVYNRRVRGSVIGVSLLRDIAAVNIAVLNWSSLIDEQIYGHCIAVLAMPKPPGADDSDVDLGVHNVLEYQGDTPPSYLSPPTDPAEHIAKMIERARDEIYRMARLGFTRGVETGAAKSGVAYSFEFNETEQALVELANSLENAETQIAELVGFWLNKEWEGIISYPNEFGVNSPDEAIKIVEGSKAQVRSPSFKREMEKDLARRLTTQLMPETRRQIAHEIEIMDEPPPPMQFGF